MDMVSLESACAALHPKLIKSYAMEQSRRGRRRQIVRRVRRRPSSRGLACTASASSPWHAGTSASREGLWLGPRLQQALNPRGLLPHHEAEKAAHGSISRRGFRGDFDGLLRPGGEAGSPPSRRGRALENNERDKRVHHDERREAKGLHSLQAAGGIEPWGPGREQEVGVVYCCAACRTQMKGYAMDIFLHGPDEEMSPHTIH